MSTRLRKVWKPQLFKRQLYSEILDHKFTISVTARTLDLIDAVYGFDFYILKVRQCYLLFNKVTFSKGLFIWLHCPSPVRHRRKTWTPSWAWTWRGPCCFAWHAETQSFTPTTLSRERRSTTNTRSVRCVLVFLLVLNVLSGFWHSSYNSPWCFLIKAQKLELWFKNNYMFLYFCLCEQQFEIPEEEAEWVGLSLEEAMEKQRQLEHKVTLSSNRTAWISFNNLEFRTFPSLSHLTQIRDSWKMLKNTFQAEMLSFCNHNTIYIVCSVHSDPVLLWLLSSRSLSLCLRSVWTSWWKSWMPKNSQSHTSWRRSDHTQPSKWDRCSFSDWKIE